MHVGLSEGSGSSVQQFELVSNKVSLNKHVFLSL